MSDNQFIIEIRSKGFGNTKKNTKALEGSIRQLREQVAKHKRGIERAVVGSKQFEERQRALERSSKNLNIALGKVNQTTSKYIRSADSMRGSTSGLRRSIGALRNNILLVTFALSGATLGIKKFVDQAAGFQAVKTRLVGLTGGVGQAERAFLKFNSVAATTPFSLDDVVNAGAQLKAFGADAEGLIKPITDLAAFMGTTATEAANAFGRAFAGGAGAADILRERGILNIIKSSQGLTDLSKTTLPNFRKALISSLQDPAVGIAGSTDRLSKTYIGAMSNMKDSVTRFQATVGDLLLPTLIKAANNAEKFFRAINVEHIETFAQSVTALAAAIALYNAKVFIAIVRTANFAKILKMSLIGFIALAIQQMMEYMGVFEDWDQIVQKNTGTLQSNSNTIQQTTKNLQAKQVVVSSLNIDMEKQARLLEDTAIQEMRLRGATNEQVQAAKILMATQQQINELAPEGIEAFVGLSESAEGWALTLRHNNEEGKTLSDNVLLPMQDIMKNAQLRLQILSGSFDENSANMDKNGKKASQAIGAIGNAVLGLAAAIKQGEAGMGDYIAALGSIIALNEATAPIGIGMQMGGQLMNIAGVGHSGGLITDRGIQRFQTGGMVSGGDNVPILAQGGEFIMNRRAVQSIGIDSLSAMNQEPEGRGGITVNVNTGHVFDDSVLSEIGTAIEKAVSRGLA